MIARHRRTGEFSVPVKFVMFLLAIIILIFLLLTVQEDLLTSIVGPIRSLIEKALGGLGGGGAASG